MLSTICVNAQTDNVHADTAVLIPIQTKELLFKKKMSAAGDSTKVHFDTIDLRKPKVLEKKIFVPDPNRSMWYALICPGLGQVYNRRYWKLPIVYGSFVGLAYGISRNSQYYKLYSRAYRDISDDNPKTNSFQDFPQRLQNKETLKSRMDAARRYRDLCIIGTVAFYAITVLDAFVDAALADFDISPDLSMRISPQVIQHQENTALAMQMRLNF